MMYRVKIMAKQGDGKPFEDQIKVSSLDPKVVRADAEKCVSDFNAYQRDMYGDKVIPRKIVKILLGKDDQLLHDWDKVDLVSGARTNYKCTQCGKKVGVTGLNVPIGGDCYPERTCRICGEVYATIQTCAKHMDRRHGRTWRVPIDKNGNINYDVYLGD